MSTVASPIRYPDARSAHVMTRRGWWLVVLNFLIPGSAQVLAGSRRMGRFGLGMTLLLWVLVVATLVVYLFWPTVVYTAATNSITLWVGALLLLFYAVLWIVLTLDTLRLVRIIKTAPRARFWIASLATVLMVVTSGVAGYGAYLATTTSTFLSDVFVAGPSEPPVDGRYNIMLLGGDAGPDRDGLRPDSMSVVSIDATTGAATIIGLPRDLEDNPFPADSPLAAVYPEGYGSIDGCEVDVCMLNSIYTEVELKSPEMYPDAVAQGSEPGIEAMRDAMEGILNITIQYYVLIDMQGFSDLIDSLGGVDITVTERVPLGGDENLEGVAEWFEPGLQHMDGYHAIWYARSRHGTSDYDRMARQRVLQEAVLQQFNPANVLSKFQGIATASSQVVKTDVPQSMLGYFVDLALKTKELPITQIELVPPLVDPEYPDYPAIQAMVAQALAPATEPPAPQQ
ncbi:LCP family protein [Compostimonas suwonensis]|uniref:LCP family protein required for cell wall assembly n=1 Tax=Compostimonas suwonensis TaxID=1048394 RepID=A0A2M9BUX2_9MICO|nr:LCP family protein [Compostimonas suwonensis]PJJ61758.1 LCP family protein required for cell wall assembly [Compostimonas suwonensis]